MINKPQSQFCEQLCADATFFSAESSTDSHNLKVYCVEKMQHCNCADNFTQKERKYTWQDSSVRATAQSSRDLITTGTDQFISSLFISD